MKYYAYIQQIDEELAPSDINAFIRYTFGKMADRAQRICTYDSIGSYYHYDTTTYEMYERYDFSLNHIYKSLDDGRTIVDASNVSHGLEPIRHSFIEVDVSLDAVTEELIEFNRTKGSQITVMPIMIEGNGSCKVIYSIECSMYCIGTKRWLHECCQGTDVYDLINALLKRVMHYVHRDSGGYYSKIWRAMRLRR